MHIDGKNLLSIAYYIELIILFPITTTIQRFHLQMYLLQIKFNPEIFSIPTLLEIQSFA